MASEFHALSERNNARWRKLRVPVAPYFELTPRCTLDCKMCYVHLTPEQMGDRRELTTEQWLRLSDEAFEAGMLYVVLTGGECMLHPGFWTIYEHLLELGVIVSVNTNAFTLTDEDIERFRLRPPAGFRITLYGASEEGYERCTGHRAFQRVVDNIVKLRNSGFHMGLAITLSRYNAEEFTQIAKLAQDLKIKYTYGLELSEANPDTNRCKEDYALSEEEMLRITLALHLQENRPLNIHEPITELPAQMPDDISCKGMRCGSGTTSYVIHWDGRMSPCFDFHGEVNVLDVGFQAAWEETKRLSREWIQPVECLNCKLRSVCAVCVLKRQNPNDPGHCDPKRCQYTIDRYNMGLTSLSHSDNSKDEDC